MNTSQLFVLSFNALTERKTRTILTILMVIVSSSLMVVLNGLSAGQTQFITEQLNQLGTDVVYVSPGQRSFRSVDSSSSIILNSVVVSKINSLPYVEEVIPRYSGSVQLTSQGNTVNTSVMYMNPEKLFVMAPKLEFVDVVQKQITDTYGPTIGVSTAQSSLAFRASFMDGLNSFILSVGMIALVVGAVGIITTLYTSVTERIREIGTMKAIGAQGRTILSLFMVEALLIGILGATLGLIVGIVAGYGLGSSLTTGLPRSSSVSPVFLPIDLLSVWLLSTGLSITAGILPAWKASQLPPIVALRRE